MTTTNVTLGRSVAESKEYLAAVKAGRIGELSFSVQNALVGSTGLVRPDVHLLTGDQARGPVPTVGLLDMISREPVSSDVVPYTYVSAVTNAAAPVAEATTAASVTYDLPGTGAVIQPAGGSYAPESSFTTARADALVQSVRTRLDLTRKAVMDAPRLEALVNGVLRRMLLAALEAQLIQGNGTAPNLLGLLATPGIQSTSVGTTNEARVADALLKSANSGGGAPTGVLMSAGTYFGYFKDSDAYRGGRPTIHKVPIILSEMPAGKLAVANWAQLMLFDRQEESVAFSDDHADFYARGLVCAIAEVRAALGVLFPASVVTMDVIV